MTYFNVTKKKVIFRGFQYLITHEILYLLTVSECHFNIRTFPHDVFVAEGEQITFICGHKDPYGDDNHIWTSCKWTRPSDGLSCTFIQKRNETTNKYVMIYRH